MQINADQNDGIDLKCLSMPKVENCAIYCIPHGIIFFMKLRAFPKDCMYSLMYYTQHTIEGNMPATGITILMVRTPLMVRTFNNTTVT